MAGTLILRPSADVSVGHKKLMSGSSVTTAAYLLVNDVVCDGYASIINHSADSMDRTSITSKFSLSVENPVTERIKIVAIRIYASGVVNGTSYGRFSHEVSLSVDNAAISVPISISYGAYDGDYPTSQATVTDAGFLEAVNAYEGLANGMIPAFTLGITSIAAQNDSSKSSDSDISQIYVEIDYESGLNIHRKVDGEWRQAQIAYQKINGAWAEISEKLLKSILAASLATKGATIKPPDNEDWVPDEGDKIRYVSLGDSIAAGHAINGEWE